jgi:hypothetical protein
MAQNAQFYDLQYLPQKRRSFGTAHRRERRASKAQRIAPWRRRVDEALAIGAVRRLTYRANVGRQKRSALRHGGAGLTSHWRNALRFSALTVGAYGWLSFYA